MTRNFALGTVGLAILIFIAEKILPAPLTPSHMIGNFVAAVEVSEIKSKQDYASGYAAAMAEAQAQAQARAQIEIEVNRQQQQRLSDSMGTQVIASNWADSAASPAVLGLFGSDNSRRDTCPARAVPAQDPQTMAQEQANIGRRPVPSKPVRSTRRRPAPVPLRDQRRNRWAITSIIRPRTSRHGKRRLGPARVEQIKTAC